PCPGCLLEDAVIIGDHGDMVTIELELQSVHLRHCGIGLDEEDADELLVEMCCRRNGCPLQTGQSACCANSTCCAGGLSMMREVLRLLVGLANFLRKLVPADPIAHPSAQLPFERFRLRIDPRP